MHLHPDDVLLFHEVATAARWVAKHYDLPLKSFEPVPAPEHATSALGYCSVSGNITIALRGMDKGVWHPEPRRAEDIWRTAAHELAHLRHFNHGVAFQEFEEELTLAIQQQQTDHREKVIARLVKMQASRESEAALGNAAAAEAFAAMINKMLIEHELNPSDLDYARGADRDPVIQLAVDLTKYRIAKKKTRIAWQESLARVVAKAHLCKFLIQTRSNNIWFVGTRSHALVAEYAYGVLVPAAYKLSLADWRRFYVACQKETGSTVGAHGFHGAWLTAFVGRIEERFAESRAAAVAAAPAGHQSTALLRLDGALVKAQAYIDDKFAKKRCYSAALNGGWSHHAAGKAAGRAAADRMTLGKAVTGSVVAKQLGGGR
jgi:hypothetical protein